MQVSTPIVSPLFYTETYTDKDVSYLCEISGLSPDDMTKFHEKLEHSAAVCRWETSKWADKPRNSDVARNLRGLIKRINRLSEGLENLEDEAAYSLGVAVDRINTTDCSLIITNKLPDEVPSMTIALPESANPVIALPLEIPEFRDILGGLERAAHDAIAGLNKGSPGQMRDYGLRLWISDMKQLWERTTNAPFTRDATASGEPITPAARFCVAAFHCLSPDYPASRILLEMKDCIRESNKRTGRIVAKKDQ
jgi:hypothetical protein